MNIFVPYLLKEVSYMVKEEVIKLKIEGKSYSEISRILGVNRTTYPSRRKDLVQSLSTAADLRPTGRITF